jgi:RNA recognition motif-containing protein
MNIYVGNLDYKVTEEELNEAFSQFGQVDSARIIMDKYSGRSKGFGFVEMGNQEEAQKAIESLNGQEFGSRPIVVNEARPRRENY